MTRNNSNARILFIAPFPPPFHGSAIVSQQIRNSRLINTAFACDYINLSTSRDLSEIGRRSIVKYWRFLSTFFLLFRKLATQRYDLCYLAITCHGKGFLKDFPYVALCKLFRRTLVIHQHNKGMSADAARWPFRWLLPIAYRNTTVILLSQSLYPDIAAQVPKDAIVVCPNGISDWAARPRPPKADDVEVEVLFISNLLASKGVLDLIGACALLKENGVAFHCRIIGNESAGIRRQDLETAISQAKLDGSVRYDGALYGPEKEAALDHADIFVLPTYDDCFPLCLLEAMSHSLPIVTTDEGGIPDIVKDGNNGLICRKRNPVSLATCIQRLIEDKGLRIRMGEEGLRMFLESFTGERFEERMVGILSQLTGA